MIQTPPGLMAAGLLFWGWQTGLWLPAILFAVMLELSRWVSWRWDFVEADYRRVWSLSVLIVVGVAVVAFGSSGGEGSLTDLFSAASGRRLRALNSTGKAALTLFRWLPIGLFPIMLANAYGRRARVELRVFSRLLRRFEHAPGMADTARRGINISYPYFAVCLVAASSANTYPQYFFWVFAVLICWALWPWRSRRFAVPVWIGTWGVVLGLGFVGRGALFEVQRLIQRVDAALIRRWYGPGFTADESRTALGIVGELKLSARIVLRVETDGSPPPGLLREASYDQFFSPFWRAAHGKFNPVPPNADETSWDLLPDHAAPNQVRIWRYLSQGEGLLHVPLGIARFDDLPVFLLETNALGAVRSGGGPGLVGYLARYGPGGSIVSAPTPYDLQIPTNELAAIRTVAEELHLREKAALGPKAVLDTLTRFFTQQFRYTTFLRNTARRSRSRTPLGEFLLKTRAGHCEYFATATVLLLRAAGIPARYATGYAVCEGHGKKYIVRARHAHAWALAYFDGTWHDVDNTPADWQQIEAVAPSIRQRIADALSDLWFQFSKWRWVQTNIRGYLIWGSLGLLALLAVRLVYTGRWKRATRRSSARPEVGHPGLDSEYYQIEALLSGAGLGRAPDETPRQWIERVAGAVPSADPLRQVIGLHYRLRFDPAGLAEPERRRLRELVTGWLGENEVGLRRA